MRGASPAHSGQEAAGSSRRMQKNQPMPALKAGNTEKKRGDLPMGQEYLPGDTPQQRLQDLMKEYKITQAELAERADVSLDTIKSVENGRRAMSLDTYLNIVHALESSPMVLMSQQHPEKHIERFAFMMNRCDEREIEFALHMIEQILRGQEDYLSE